MSAGTLKEGDGGKKQKSENLDALERKELRRQFASNIALVE